MARIASINLPPNKRIEIALTYIFGIGRSLANKILEKVNINPDKKVKELNEQEVDSLKQVIEREYKVEGELKREIGMNVKRLKDIGCYRGVRHAKHLPVRGQRTRTNSRTVRGNVKKTVGSGRRPPARKV